MKLDTLLILHDFLNLLSLESEGIKNENGIKSVIGIRRTETGTRMGTDGTRTVSDPGS